MPGGADRYGEQLCGVLLSTHVWSVVSGPRVCTPDQHRCRRSLGAWPAHSGIDARRRTKSTRCRAREQRSRTVWSIPDDVSKMAFLTMTLHQGGATRMYALTPDLRPSLLSSLSGDRRFSRFGGVLHLSDLDEDGLGRKGGWSAPLAEK